MLDSGLDQDIVVAGSTSYDNNAVAMQAIESYWSIHGNDAGDAIDLGPAYHWLFWRMVVAGGGGRTDDRKCESETIHLHMIGLKLTR